jgi:hypothetical protein
MNINKETNTTEFCLETRAKLLIYSEDISPYDISVLISLNPTEKRKKGDSITNSIGRTRIHKSNLWILSSEGIVESLNLGDHLDWLLQQLIQSKEKILLLQENKTIKMRISCVWYSKGDKSGIALTPIQMKIMSELNLTCDFDLYFFDD